jgi:hypothetical protein
MELFVAGVGMVLLGVLAFALVLENGRARVLGADAHKLARLRQLRSPSGKRFYPTGEAPLELSAELDEITGDAAMRPTTPQARPRPPRGGERVRARASRYPRPARSAPSR